MLFTVAWVAIFRELEVLYFMARFRVIVGCHILYRIRSHRALFRTEYRREQIGFRRRSTTILIAEELLLVMQRTECRADLIISAYVIRHERVLDFLR